MTRTVDTETLRGVINETARVLREGPRGRAFELKDELGAFDHDAARDAIKLVVWAVGAADAARGAHAIGNDLEEQEHQAVFASYVEGLDDLALELDGPCLVCGAYSGEHDEGCGAVR